MTLYLTLSSSIAAEVEKRTSRPLEIDGLVRWNGRLCFLRGFDPMGATVPRAFLEDAETGEPRIVPLDDLVDTVAADDAA